MNEEAVLTMQWHAARSAEETSNEQRRPFVLLRPTMLPDGNKWCALYGVNIQNGVAGFGDTPEAAAKDFDKNWFGQKLRGEP